MATTARGHIEQLPSGSFRVHVYAGTDPERLRGLYDQHKSASGSDSLAALASVIGPQAGLEEDAALAWLTEFAAAD
jgi:hypothetical protein